MREYAVAIAESGETGRCILCYEQRGKSHIEENNYLGHRITLLGSWYGVCAGSFSFANLADGLLAIFSPILCMQT